jgi:thiol-disulfide isomerase/thioredoxin
MKRLLSTTAVLIILFAAAPRAAHAVGTGDKAPSFNAADLAGKPFSYKGTEGNVTFVNFWATWCAPCAVEFPELNKLASEYHGRVKVLAISLDEGDAKAKVQKFLDKRAPGALSLQVLTDKEEKSAEDYNVNAMPTTFVVDKKGVVRYVHTGFSSEDTGIWRDEVKKLLQ